MLEKASKILFSTRLTAILFIVFAAAMATGTFMDAGQETSPTPYSRTLIYNTWWFEAIMVFFVINFVGNIFRFRLYKKAKWATLTLHLAFIFILLGAFVTRYIGYEGMMAIREGATENKFLSRDTYVTAYIDGDYMINGVPQRLSLNRMVDFSPRLDNDFQINANYDKQPVSITLEKFIAGAEEDIVPDENGEEYLKVVEAGGGKPHNHFLKVGEVQSLHNVLVALNKPTQGAINITYTDSTFTIQSPFEGEYLQMATGNQGKLIKDSIQPLMLRSRYLIGNMQMVFPKPMVKGVFDIVKKPQILKGDDDGLIFNINTGGETKRVSVLGGQGTNNAFKQIKVGGLDIALKYGSKVLDLPFEVKLNDFIAEKYPGTEKSYSSYESKVTVFDKEKGDFDYRIYMNNILDHRGYRFFQASYDPDEKGTILSVNHDRWGTWLTYLGYFLLYLGLMAILFDKNTRFGDLKRMLNKVKEKKTKLITILMFCFGLLGFSQQPFPKDNHDHAQITRPTKAQIDSILNANVAPKEHAEKFGRLVVQDVGGRMMPMNTYASELLRKLSKKDTYEMLDANQVLLSMQESKFLWYNVPVIYMAPRKTDSIRSIIGVPKTGKHFALADFFTPEGIYKLAPYLDEAYKNPVPTGHESMFRDVDQRVNLLYSAIEGESIKIFPLPEDDNNKWISATEFRRANYREQIKDSSYASFVKSGFNYYLLSLNSAKRSGDFAQAEKLLESFKKTQQRYGSQVMLSDEKVEAEVTYNKLDPFKKLFSWYMYAGSLLFIFLVIQIFKDSNRFIDISVKILVSIVLLLFLYHTGSLIWRWYISGHAPWSDAYESMIYVAWSLMLFGLLLSFRRSKIKNEKKTEPHVAAASMMSLPNIFQKDASYLTVAAAAFITSMILMIAHWNWMDPAIANLQPVLNSYWLMIHVAVIVGSYGPLALGMILGLVALILMIFTNSKNKAKMDLNIKELTIINEMALTVGLVMLTIGNFLGGMWANESWGRYWGWDPKETWALISIMIYAFVIHMRLVPGLRGRWLYNLMSVLAFASIMMTYFGVNFYLAGLHSYASGDQIVSVKFIAVSLGIIAVIAFFAKRQYNVFFKK